MKLNPKVISDRKSALLIRCDFQNIGFSELNFVTLVSRGRSK